MTEVARRYWNIGWFRVLALIIVGMLLVAVIGCGSSTPQDNTIDREITIQGKIVDLKPETWSYHERFTVEVDKLPEGVTKSSAVDSYGDKFWFFCMNTPNYVLGLPGPGSRQLRSVALNVAKNSGKMHVFVLRAQGYSDNGPVVYESFKLIKIDPSGD